LSENSDMSPIDHLGLEEFEIADICVPSLEFNHVSNLLQLAVDERSISIALGMDTSKNIVAILPPIFLGEPSRVQLANTPPSKQGTHLGLSGQKKRPPPRKMAGSI